MAPSEQSKKKSADFQTRQQQKYFEHRYDYALQ